MIKRTLSEYLGFKNSLVKFYNSDHGHHHVLVYYQKELAVSELYVPNAKLGPKIEWVSVLFTGWRTANQVSDVFLFHVVKLGGERSMFLWRVCGVKSRVSYSFSLESKDYCTANTTKTQANQNRSPFRFV